ncbi:zinc knuckle CX2CX4HX4C containing protein [Tanacetum coccineum]
MSANVSSEVPNFIGLTINVVPSSYANKLNPKSLTKANLQKTKANVPNGADYDIFHDILLVAYTSDGLSLMAKKIGNPMMLDSYTNSMCLESWGQSSYARILIEINACNDFSDHLVMAIPNLKGNGYTKETIRIKYEWEPPRCSPCLIFGHSHADCPKSLKVAPIRVVNQKDKVDKINVLEKHILEGKLVLVDDDGKPLEKVEYLVNLGSDD